MAYHWVTAVTARKIQRNSGRAGTVLIKLTKLTKLRLSSRAVGKMEAEPQSCIRGEETRGDDITTSHSMIEYIVTI